MTTCLQVVVSKKARKVIYIRSQGIIVNCWGAYYELTISNQSCSRTKDIEKLLEPLRQQRNGFGLAKIMQQALELTEIEENDGRIRSILPGFTITYK